MFSNISNEQVYDDTCDDIEYKIYDGDDGDEDDDDDDDDDDGVDDAGGDERASIAGVWLVQLPQSVFSNDGLNQSLESTTLN